MGDGGCAVLSSRHPLAEFCNSDACHKEQPKARHNWTAELVSVTGRGPVGERSHLALLNDDQNFKWPSTTMSDMESGNADGIKQASNHASRWDKPSETLWHSGGDEIIVEVDEDAACKSHEGYDEASKTGHPSRPSQAPNNHCPENIVKTTTRSPSNSAQCNVDREDNTSHECGLRDIAQERQQVRNASVKYDRTAQVDLAGSEQQCIAGGGSVPKVAALEEVRAQKVLQSEAMNVNNLDKVDGNNKSMAVLTTLSRDADKGDDIPLHKGKNGKTSENAACCSSKEVSKEYPIGCNASNETERNFERSHQSIKRDRVPGFLGAYHAEHPNSRTGSRKDPDSLIQTEEHTTSGDPKRETKGKKTFDRVDQSSIHSSSRHYRRGHENGERSSDSHSSKDEYRHGERELHDSYTSRDERRHGERELHESHSSRDEHRHGERDPHESHSSRDEHRYGSKRRNKPRERSYESRSNARSVEFSKHRHDTDRYSGRSSLSDNTGYSTHGKDSHSRSRSNADSSCYSTHGRDSHKSHSDHSGGRSYSAKVDDRHIRDDRSRYAAAKGDEKGPEAETYLVCTVEEHTLPPTVTNDDDSRSIEMDVPMDLSPAPAEDSTGRPSEVTWIGAGDPGPSQKFLNSCPESDGGAGWVYIDYEGNTQGPVELSTLHSLWRDGKLQPDHMVKIEGSNMWVTLEHAGMVVTNAVNEFSSKLAQPTDDESVSQHILPVVSTEATFLEQQQVSGNEIVDAIGGHYIDKRVEQLMHGFTLVSGREKEVISEALIHAARQVDQGQEEDSGNEIDFAQNHSVLTAHWTEGHVLESQVSDELGIGTDISQMNGMGSFQSAFQSSRRWTTGGGDWKLVCQSENPCLPKGPANLERPFKMVLNRGIPLCDGRPCSLPDPRKMCQEPSIHEVARWKHLELPPFAYRFWDAQGQLMNAGSESSQMTLKFSMFTPKSQASTPFSHVSASKDGVDGVKKLKTCKGIDAKVETIKPSKGEVGISPRFSSLAVKNGQALYRSHEDESQNVFFNDDSSTSLTHQEADFSNEELAKHDRSVEDSSGHCSKLAQHLPTKEDLRLNEGEWFYRDGAGHEVGPYLYRQLENQVRDGLLCEGTSVYRKSDETWVSICIDTFANQIASDRGKEAQATTSVDEPLPFHKQYPQFMGYMCGELHQHLMKSYRTTNFPAMLMEGLDKWLQTRSMVDTVTLSENFSLQCSSGSSEAKLEKQRERDVSDLSSPVILTQGSCSVQSSDFSKHHRSGRTKNLQDIEDFKPGFRSEISIIELFTESRDSIKEGQNEGWQNMDPYLLIRVFSFLEADIRSLIVASTTCKGWRVALMKLKRHVEQIDLSCLGSLCSDAIFLSYMEHAYKLSRVVLRGCTTLSPSAVRTFLEHHDTIMTVDVYGCDQLKELVDLFPHISWVRESHRKCKGSKSLVEKTSSTIFKYHGGVEEGSNFKDRLSLEDVHFDGIMEPMDCDPPHGLERDLEVSRTPNCVKRMKLNSSGKYKTGVDSTHCKIVSRDCAIVGTFGREKEQGFMHEGKHKQRSTSMGINTVATQISVSSRTDLASTTVEKLTKTEKDMAHVLQRICQVLGGRSSEFSKIEDKLRRGSYQGIKSGFAKFKDDLYTVCRKFLRGNKQELLAGKEVFKITFRLIAQLEEGRKTPCRDAKPYKRKHQDHDFRSSLAGRKREVVGETMRKLGLAKRRKGLDESNADDVWETETSGTDVDDTLCHGDDEDETDVSEFEVESDSEVGGGHGQPEVFSDEEANDHDWNGRYWGARMTKAAMVPPVTRKYELIEEYVIVADAAEVGKRMGVNLPEDYDKKWQEAQGIEYSHLELPDLRDYEPRKLVQDEVVEQEVYGIDPYTHNLLMDSLPAGRLDFPDARRHQFIEEDLLKALNQEARQFTGSGKAPTTYPLDCVVERIVQETKDLATRSFASTLLRNMRSRPKDKYVAYRKGLGVVCNHKPGFIKDEFVVEFFGEVYPAWRWFEKQDAIRLLQKKDNDPAPEFYNIFLERPKGDATGYDLVVVDAMHKANYASRICHACRPNCEARVTAVDGRYQIGVYTLRSVEYGEELTFDYNSITESKEEYEKSICLCGSQGCRGSYLHLAGPETFQEIMKEFHGLLHRHDLLLRACTDSCPQAQDWDDLRQAGLGSCLLDDLPDWTVCYAAGVVRFMNKERKYLPKEILKTITKERRLESYSESEALEAEIQADGVFNGRLQNLAITLDKVRYVFKKLYEDPKLAPPPLRKLEPEEAASLIWKNEDSVVSELLDAMYPHCTREEMLEFKRKVREHEPSLAGNIEKNLRQSLLWLRDELCETSAAHLCRHDAAADLVHMYAHTKLFFTSQDYPAVESPSLTISPLDLGPKHAHLLGSASYHEWRKTYNRDYVLGQLIFWYKHNSSDPGSSLAKVRRGCLVLPDPSSCYTKSGQERLAYGNSHRSRLFRIMEQMPQRPWSWKGQLFWEFRNNQHLFGSPMMDAVRHKMNVNKELIDWLKRRRRTFEGPWDNQ